MSAPAVIFQPSPGVIQTMLASDLSCSSVAPAFDFTWSCSPRCTVLSALPAVSFSSFLPASLFASALPLASSAALATVVTLRASRASTVTSPATFMAPPPATMARVFAFSTAMATPPATPTFFAPAPAMASVRITCLSDTSSGTSCTSRFSTSDATALSASFAVEAFSAPVMICFAFALKSVFVILSRTAV